MNFPAHPVLTCVLHHRDGFVAVNVGDWKNEQ
jgi:hypothetical protein